MYAQATKHRERFQQRSQPKKMCETYVKLLSPPETPDQMQENTGFVYVPQLFEFSEHCHVRIYRAFGRSRFRLVLAYNKCFVKSKLMSMQVKFRY